MQRLEGDPSQTPPAPPIDPTPSHCAAWVVAPHVPKWMRDWERAGTVTLDALGEGCYALRPSLYPIVWVAANETPMNSEAKSTP